MRCNCESSHCAHHSDKSCPNEADGRYVMAMVGTVCKQCAETTKATGGSHYITESMYRENE